MLKRIAAHRYFGFELVCVLVWCAAFVYNTPVSCLVWDDAFMFVRYAERILLGGGVAWNPDNVPTWGPTSLAFLGVVLPMRLAVAEPQAAAFAASFCAGALLFVLLIRLVVRVVPAPSSARLLALGSLLATLTGCGNSLATHFRSGMDTTFSMAYLTAYLLAAHRLAHGGDGVKTWAAASLPTGLLGGMVLVVRPDLGLYTAIVPLVLATSGKAEVRRAAVRALLVTLLVSGSLWVACFRYFHTPVPLSFYVKSLGSTDATLTALYRSMPGLHLRLYLRATWPLLIVVTAGAFRHGRALFRQRIELGVAIATLSFIVYYRYGVLQVMHYSQRFYYPTLPALIYLAAAAFSRLTGELPRLLARIGRGLGSEINLRRLGMVVLALATLAEFKPNAPGAVRAAFCPAQTPKAFADRVRQVWPGLGVASELSDDLVIATTEVGIPGALNPLKTIVDTSGLNDPAIALGSRTVSRAVLTARADLVYLHRDYEIMNRQLTTNPAFVAGYVRRDGRAKPAVITVYLRQASRHFSALTRAVDADQR